jgi:hypothetical protein
VGEWEMNDNDKRPIISSASRYDVESFVVYTLIGEHGTPLEYRTELKGTEVITLPDGAKDIHFETWNWDPTNMKFSGGLIDE